MATPKQLKPIKKEPLQTPKGMRDLVGNEYFSYQGFFEKAAEVALYYGFKPIETPVLEYTDVFVKGTGEGTDIVEKEMFSLRTKGGDNLTLRPEGTPGVMRAYLEHGMQTWSQPVMLYYGGSFFRYERPQHGRFREFKQFSMEVLGTERSIVDAMVIRITALILEEAGIKDTIVEINSIGDKNCRHLYRKALVNYYKKHGSELCPDCKRRLKTNPLRLLDCKEPKCAPIKEHAPTAISYLCDPCKHHFREVLESLETMGVNYQINNQLVRGLDYYTRTVFEITAPTDETHRHALAGGGRYDYLAKTLGSKRDIPAMGVSIGVDRILGTAGVSDLVPRIVKKPKIYFIQLGQEAKMKSMVIIEILRKAKIPVLHSLSKDSLSAQLSSAERSQIPFALILGQKEVIDDTVIVRNMENRSQDTVPIAKLHEYLKVHLK